MTWISDLPVMEVIAMPPSLLVLVRVFGRLLAAALPCVIAIVGTPWRFGFSRWCTGTVLAEGVTQWAPLNGRPRTGVGDIGRILCCVGAQL